MVMLGEEHARRKNPSMASVVYRRVLDSTEPLAPQESPARRTRGTSAMGSVVVSCDGCGVRIRIHRPESALDRPCPRCGTPLLAAVMRACEPKPKSEPDELDLPIQIEPDEQPSAEMTGAPEPAGSRGWQQFAIASVLIVPALL